MAMTAEQKYLFDLNGYLVLREVLSAVEVAETSAALMSAASLPPDKFPASAKRVMGGAHNPISPSDIEIFNLVECGESFERPIGHPAILPIVQEMISHPRIRLTSSYAIVRSKGDATALHRGRVPILQHCQYRFENGQFHCAFIKVVWCLTDLQPGDGGFAVIPGSHKSNFPCPYFVKGKPESSVHPDRVAVLQDVLAKAGDVVIFTEDLTHGAKTNVNGKRRLNLYYSYQPSYMPDEMDPPSEALMARLTPDRRALLMPPRR